MLSVTRIATFLLIILALAAWKRVITIEFTRAVSIESTNVKKNKNATSSIVVRENIIDSVDSSVLTSNVTRILTPPYQIFQFGAPRTASTFQFKLLCSIAEWKDGSNPPSCQYISKGRLRSQGFRSELRERINQGQSFVYKAHDDSDGYLESFSDQIAFFSSGEVGESYALYTHSFDNVQRCPTCEIRKYAPFFQLTADEVSQMENHMTLFGIIRQCCGFQMSKYEMQRLHGCNMTNYINRPEYPYCEQHHNMSAIETAFHNSPIPYVSNNPRMNWALPGDCQRFRNEIKSRGIGFNRKPFRGCIEI